MSPDSKPIRLIRGRGGEVEVIGSFDAFAGEILRRAGFLFEPALRGNWIRLPFDLGHDWENEHATWAAEMLTAARYPVDLDPDLRARSTEPGTSAAPARLPAMTAQVRPRPQPHR